MLRSVALALGTLALLCTTGCTTVCSAVGYVSSVRVEVADPEGRMSALVSCVGDRCATSDPLDSALDTGPRRVDGDGFDVEFGMELPDSVELRAVDDEGVVIATETFVLAWERTDGGGSCPGPVETDPIEFDLG